MHSLFVFFVSSLLHLEPPAVHCVALSPQSLVIVLGGLTMRRDTTTRRRQVGDADADDADEDEMREREAAKSK